MSEVPPGCGPHRKAASFRLSPTLNIEQAFVSVKNHGPVSRLFLKEMRQRISLSTLKQLLDGIAVVPTNFL